jgi:hypothetical protein
MRDMVKESKYGLMDLSTKAIGKEIWPMVEEDLFMLMAMYTTVIGKTIRLMALVNTPIQMGLNTKDNGLMINSMEKVKKPGQMVHIIRVSTSLVKKMATESFSGRINPLMLVNSWTTTSMEKVLTNGLTVDNTLEAGK